MVAVQKVSESRGRFNFYGTWGLNNLRPSLEERIQNKVWLEFLLEVTKYSGIRQWLWLRNGFPGGAMIKNLPANAGGERDIRSSGFNPWVGKIPWRRRWQPTPVLLPRKCHGQRIQVCYVHGVTKSQTWLRTRQQQTTKMATELRQEGGQGTTFETDYTAIEDMT